MATTSSDYPGQAVVRFEFQVPGGTRITFDPSIVTHQRSTLADTVYGIGAYSHEFVSTTPDYVDNVLKRVMSSGTPIMRMRLGVGTPDNVFWQPWQQQVIVSIVAHPEGIGNQAGHAFTITSADIMRLLTRANPIKAHRGLISTIVEDMLGSYNLTDTVIEPTLSTGLYAQSLIPDEEFIRNRMIPRALSVNGRVGYYFFCRDNTIHFHSQGYQGNIHTASYYRSNDNILTQADNSQTMVRAGNVGTSIIVYDPFVGRSAEYGSDAERALTLADSVYDLPSIPNGERKLVWHAASNPVDEAKVIMQYVYESARRQTFVVGMDLIKTIGIRHGDLLRLVLSPRDSEASPWSGLYFVAGTTTTVERGEIKTDYTLERGEIQRNRSNIVQADGDRLVSELEAKGQPVNLAEFESSDKTKGGEQVVNENVFRTVRDPD